MFLFMLMNIYLMHINTIIPIKLFGNLLVTDSKCIVQIDQVYVKASKL